MQTIHRSPLLIAVLLAANVHPARAQQPPDVVVSDGNNNTAMGTGAMSSLTSGVDNTAAGAQALYSNSNGAYNTAIGLQTLYYNTYGSNNTAVGTIAMFSNTIGVNNTAYGDAALAYNTSGNDNTAVGNGALFSNGTASSNTASGFESLYSNTTGPNNTAFGAAALYSNTSGKGNAAQGVNAMYGNTTGIRNLGIGNNALYANTTGSYNIALGFEAGYNVTTGSNNIEIGATGAAADNNTIQIGAQGTQTSTKIAGIFGTPLSGSAVYVNSSGQLGVQASSERFKTEIATMPAPSARLSKLRPVTFRYKTDPKRVPQYGLIAEEVDKVYPELVIRDDAGRIAGIHYEELAPILLNEVQVLQRRVRDQQKKLGELEQLKRQVAKLLARDEEVATR
jgi:trimeric autotransporter adhesin